MQTGAYRFKQSQILIFGELKVPFNINECIHIQEVDRYKGEVLVSKGAVTFGWCSAQEISPSVELLPLYRR